MALEKAETLPTGIPLPKSYWVIERVDIYPLAKTGMVTMVAFANAAARVGGRTPVLRKSYFITQEIYNARFSPAVLDTRNPVAAAYAFVKEERDAEGQRYFESAVDV